MGICDIYWHNCFSDHCIDDGKPKIWQPNCFNRPRTRWFVWRLYGSINEGCRIITLRHLVASIDLPNYLHSAFSTGDIGVDADQIRQQSFAELRLDTGHTYTICHVHFICDHWISRAIPRIRDHNRWSCRQICWRMLSDFLWRIPDHERPSQATRRHGRG